MCNKPLAVRYSTPGSGEAGVKRYICSTHVPGNAKISHYAVAVAGAYNQIRTQVIHSPPFVIYNKLGSDRSEINKWINGQLRKVLEVPRFPLGTDMLAFFDKVKLYMLFS